MSALLPAFFFLLGAIVASFVGVLAGRLATGQSFVRGHSRCDRCGAVLGVADLVPIISYFLAFGRARCCGARISFISPLSEFVLGSLYLLSYLRLGLSFALFFMLAALALLLALVLYDLVHQILPPPLLLAFCVAAALFCYVTALNGATLRFTVTLALAFAAFFAVLWGASGGRAMGLADSPLALGLALLTGTHAFIGFLLSFWIGAAVGIVLLVQPWSGATMKSEVPFAPFLALGFLLAYFTQWDPFALSQTLGALFGSGLP